MAGKTSSLAAGAQHSGNSAMVLKHENQAMAGDGRGGSGSGMALKAIMAW
jgi:hypothetical protein